MAQLAEMLKTTDIPYEGRIRGISPNLSGDCDCVDSNCEGGWGACECNCDCPNE